MDEMDILLDDSIPTMSDEEKQELALFESKHMIVFNAIRENELAVKQIKQSTDKLKADLLKAMEEYGIKSINNDLVSISYVAPSKRVTVDSKALKEEMPEVFKEYSKISDVKASIRVKVK